jgi:hypothetical protein
MQYLEELVAGDCFEAEIGSFIVTTDFKKNGQRLCINLKSGISRWLESNHLIEKLDIFKLDKENNIIAIKERTKTTNDTSTNTNIS